MNWIPVTESLPKDGQYVLIYLPDMPWSDGDDPNVFCKVAKFVRGQENPTTTLTSADKHGNNEVPYNWEEFGVDSWFGQEVTHWMHLCSPGVRDESPLTKEFLSSFGRRTDHKILCAKEMSGPDSMYFRIHQLEKETGVKWQTIHGPVYVGDLIMMYFVRPRNDDVEYNEKIYLGECTNEWELSDDEVQPTAS